MKKPLAGRRAFEAMGRRMRSQGIPCVMVHAIGRSWPGWARDAWITGYVLNPPYCAIENGLRAAVRIPVKRVIPATPAEDAATGAAHSRQPL